MSGQFLSGLGWGTDILVVFGSMILEYARMVLENDYKRNVSIILGRPFVIEDGPLCLMSLDLDSICIVNI